MPNPEVGRISVPEDELYVNALHASSFSNLSTDVLYMLGWMEQSFSTMQEAAAYISEIIGQLGFPLLFDADNAMPDDKFWSVLRTSSHDLFGKPWAPGTAGGLTGSDQYDPGDIDGDGIYIEPDGMEDGFDFIAGANKTVGLIILCIILWFGGKDIIKLFRKSGGWVAKGAIALVARQKAMEARRIIEDTETGVRDLLSDNDEITKQLALNHKNSEMITSVFDALEYLGIALDTNTNKDYKSFHKFVTNIDNPEPDTV